MASRYVTEDFELIDCDPSVRLSEKVVRNLNQVVGESPSDAWMHGELRQTRDGFEGHLKICSAAGEFTADSNNRDAAEAVNQLTKSMHLKLEAWKKHRDFQLD